MMEVGKSGASPGYVGSCSPGSIPGDTRDIGADSSNKHPEHLAMTASALLREARERRSGSNKPLTRWHPA